jgi:hypothetical protein
MALPQGETMFRNGWAWQGGAKKSAFTLGLTLNADRVSHDFTLTAPDGTSWPWSPVSWSSSGMGTLTVSNPWGLGTGSVPNAAVSSSQTVMVNANMGYGIGGGMWTLTDATTGESQPFWPNGAGYYALDLSTWWLPPTPVALQISLSRWGHDLRIRQVGGGEYYVMPGSSQGGLVQTPSGAWVESYYYFDGSSQRRPIAGFDWCVYDATIDEYATPNTTDLVNWICPLQPENVTATQTGVATVELTWQLGFHTRNDLLGGGFRIERSNYGPWGSYQWLTGGNASDFLVPQADGSLRFHYIDSNPTPLSNYSYRIVYYYGSKESSPAQSPDLFVLDEETLDAMDSDADEFTDAEEFELGTDRFASNSKPTSPPLSIVEPVLWIKVLAGQRLVVPLKAKGGAPSHKFKVTSGTNLGNLGYLDDSGIDVTAYDNATGETRAEIAIQIFEYAPEGSGATIEYTVNKRKEGKVNIEVVAPKLAIRKIGFNGTEIDGANNYHQLQSDPDPTSDSIEYEFPHYVPTDMDVPKRSYPVAFTSGTTPHLYISIQIEDPQGLVLPDHFPVRVQASLLENAGSNVEMSWLSEKQMIEAARLPGGQRVFYLPFTATDAPFPNQVRHWGGLSPLPIIWRFFTDSADGESVPLGIRDSTHVVYLTRAAPITTAKANRYETLFDIACRRASGMSNAAPEGDLINTIYGEFVDQNVQRVIPTSGVRDGHPMEYWRKSADSTPDNRETGPLLRDRIGRCEGWAKFFIDVLRCHGIDSTFVAIVPPPPVPALTNAAIALALDNHYSSGTQGTYTPNPDPQKPDSGSLFVKNWNLTTGTIARVIQDEIGMKGQGPETDPYSIFNAHALVRYDVSSTEYYFYDPSYGGQRQPSLADWEENNVAGYGWELHGNYHNDTGTLIPSLQTNDKLNPGTYIWTVQDSGTPRPMCNVSYPNPRY